MTLKLENKRYDTEEKVIILLKKDYFNGYKKNTEKIDGNNKTFGR